MTLPRESVASPVSYDELYGGGVHAAPIDERSIGSFLRFSLGLSAWKAFRDSRWALRVNPSSGNLHPTEAYVVFEGRVCHYAPREHALEERARLPAMAWEHAFAGGSGLLVALTSIHWREAWKYGERAFRYCQHDIGHAIAALRLSAALLGWRLTLLPSWSDEQVAGLLGLDREDNRSHGAEREHPECIALVGPAADEAACDAPALVDGARESTWHGRANRLSAGHVDWPIIDTVAQATRYPGRPSVPRVVAARPPASATGNRDVAAHAVITHRRSAIAFDARSTLPRERLISMLSRLQPVGAPWDAIDWPPHVHLALFVHRVDGLTPGIYACLRDRSVMPEWQAAMRPEFLWEPVNAPNDGLFLLLPTDVTWPATRISCDQDIAGAGYFSLGMIARVASSLRDRGEWFYRRLFWECGMVGQVLYLEAEAAGARGTGIGCFYDDAVHELLGLSGAEWQSLYHFSMGMPVEDARLTSEPGYGWEAPPSS